MATAPPEIFDRQLRRRRRDRAAIGFADHAFLIDRIGDELIDRLDDVTRDFSTVLDLGCHDGRLGRRLAERGLRVVSADPGARFAARAGGVMCDEDRLPFADAQFDLVVSAGVLDQVADLPGALTLIRRVLKPDGLLLAGFVGAGSLPLLRDLALAADLATGTGVSPRIHPQIDVRSAGDLLQRAGFALPVADLVRLEVGYGDPIALVRDLRGMAAGNVLAGPRPRPILRAGLSAMLARFADGSDDRGRRRETFELLFMTGWSPGPDQPKPARRGSASASLAQALARRD